MPKRIMPPGPRPGVGDRDLMAHPGELVSGRQARRPGAHDQHPLAGGRRRGGHGPALPDGLVAEEALHRVDADRAVQLRPVAGGLARPVAGPAHHRGQRVVLHDLLPGQLVPALLGVVEPLLDVLPGRAGVVTRRQPVHVDRPLGPPRAGLVGQARTHVQGDSEGLVPHGVSSGASPKRAMLRSAVACSRAMTASDPGREQVRIPRLQLQVLLDRHLLADLRHAGHLAAARLEHREQAVWLGQPGDLDRVGGGAAPAERAGHQDVQVAGAVELHRAVHLVLQVAQPGDGGRGHVRDIVRHRDQGRVLALAERSARLGSDDRGGGWSGRPGEWRRSAAPRCSCKPRCRSR